MSSDPLLSHGNSQSLEAAIQKIALRIQTVGDAPGYSVKDQLHLLEELSRFELGRYLIQHQGLNGFWTHYILTHDPKKGTQHKEKLERFLLEEAPTVLATRERFHIFLEENQKSVFEGACLACIPCGIMSELLYLNFNEVKHIQLWGIDYDPQALEDAQALGAEKNRLSSMVLHQMDAWEMHFEEKFDLISSNGLNIYVKDEHKKTQLYQNFYTALKPGGRLVTSFLTFPPSASAHEPHSEWNLNQIDPKALNLQKTIFGVLQVKWIGFNSTEQIETQLSAVGFKNITVRYDKAKMFPTVIALK